MSTFPVISTWIKTHSTIIVTVCAIITLLILIGQIFSGQYYKDADGDSFGNPNASIWWVWQPDGYVKNNGDCYDGNKDAHPGQSGFFAAHRGDGSFDYDCNKQAQQITIDKGACNNGKASPQGWEDTPPECGDTGRWLHDCDRKLVAKIPPKWETIKEFQDRVMKCR